MSLNDGTQNPHDNPDNPRGVSPPRRPRADAVAAHRPGPCWRSDAAANPPPGRTLSQAQSCQGSREGRTLVLHQVFSRSVPRQTLDRLGTPRSRGLHTSRLLYCSWFWSERGKQVPSCYGEPWQNQSRAGSGSLAGVICNCRAFADNKGPLTSDFWPPAPLFRAVCRNQAVPGGSVSKSTWLSARGLSLGCVPAQPRPVLALKRVRESLQHQPPPQSFPRM